ncbi:MAG: TPM domain-containing protein [Lachnospiraceae bacterium]|nr:TPM domain-containing protein [Lachnospiraceae bacterium]
MRKLTRILLALYVFMLTLCSAAAMVLASEKRVFDDADLFTDSEEEKLEKKIQDLKADSGIDIVIVTTNDTGWKSTQEYADDFYDDGGYGTGSDYEGILYLIDMDNRQIYLSTSGTDTIEYLNDNTINRILDGDAYRYIADGDYYNSARAAVEDTIYYYKKNKKDASEGHYEGGETYYTDGTGQKDSGGFNVDGRLLGISGGAGAAVAGVSVGVMRRNRGGKVTVTGYDYMRKGATRVNDKHDIFIRRSVVRHRISRDNDSGGGGHGGFSSVHTSSGGHTHGGGGHGF